MKTIEYYYVGFSREDWGQLGAGFYPVCFSSVELAEEYARQEIVRRLGPEGTPLKVDPKSVSFDDKDDSYRQSRDINAHASYEVTKWTVEHVRMGYVCVRFHESVRVSLPPQKDHGLFTGYSRSEREAPYQLVREPDTRSGVAFGFTVEEVSVQVFDDVAEAAAAQ